MSTRSRIGIATGNGGVRSIYCHHDGYPKGVGACLNEHYRDPEKIERLLALGDISSLGPNLGRKHNLDWRFALHDKYGRDYEAMYASPEYKRLDSMVTAYGRDRGETGIDQRLDESLDEFWDKVCHSDQEYAYLWIDGDWFIAEPPYPLPNPLPPPNLQRLSSVLAAEAVANVAHGLAVAS